MLGAEALISVGDIIPALRKLERLESSGLDLENRLAVHALRATGFEGLEMRSEAGRAWLIYARDATGAARNRAIEKAVRLAVEEGDELSVLFAVKQADDPALEARLAPFARYAREKLGLTDARWPSECRTIRKGARRRGLRRRRIIARRRMRLHMPRRTASWAIRDHCVVSGKWNRCEIVRSD